MKTAEPQQCYEREQPSARHTRFRRAKRLLRPLPRRANLHRWPIIKWFAKAARKSPHLWRFGEREVRMALYLGTLIAFLPIMGAQFIIAFLVALVLRANLLVMMATQLITNPITFVPIYLFTSKLGSWLVDLWGLPTLHNGLTKQGYQMIVGGIVVGLLTGFILDLIFRFFVFRRLNKRVNVKRMLKS